MVAVAAQITGISAVCSTVSSGADQRKHRSFAPLTFVRGIHRWSVVSPHESPVTRKMFPFDDVILYHSVSWLVWNLIDIDPVLEYDMFTRFSNSRARIYTGWSNLITVTSLECHQITGGSPHKGPGTREMFPFDDVIMRSSLFELPDFKYLREQQSNIIRATFSCKIHKIIV